MIFVSLREEPQSYYVKAEGHSGFAGNSIVCAGASALLESWRLTEELLEGVKVTFGEGCIEGRVPKTETSKVLFVQLSIGLQALARQHPKEIKIDNGGHHGI